MSTEKMREFKAWWLDDQQAELRRSCAEGWALIIWQASRAAIEVELPESFDSYGPNGSACSDSDTVIFLDQAIDAIKSTGIKIK